MKTGLHDSLALLGRLLVAAIFIYGGIDKSLNFGLFGGLMSAHHVSGHLLPAVIALELGGGLALILGLLTRLVAAVLAVYSIAAIVLFLLPPANNVMLILVLAEIGMIGGLVSYLANGAG
ncbi:MAG: DoxX family membrane protein, partial [Gammaproteobacteria bacterium]|nr:DoxX family membrane protein [Gammaproteobacteria bacterium]